MALLLLIQPTAVLLTLFVVRFIWYGGVLHIGKRPSTAACNTAHQGLLRSRATLPECIEIIHLPLLCSMFFPKLSASPVRAVKRTTRSAEVVVARDFCCTFSFSSLPPPA